MEQIGDEEVEEFIGIRGWASSTPGIGGVIKLHVDDFVVDEVLSNGMRSRDCLTSPHIIPGAGDHLLCVLEKKNRDTLRFSACQKLLPRRASSQRGSECAVSRTKGE